MTWIYRIPHLWDKPRTVWEDIYLRPEGAAENAPWIHLTVDALGDGSHSAMGDVPTDEERRFHADLLQKMGDDDFWIDESEEAHLNGTDIWLKAEDFSKDELIRWTEIWLHRKNYVVKGFKEVPFLADKDENEPTE